MSHTQHSTHADEFPGPGEIIRLVVKKRAQWIGCAIACGALAVVYALFSVKYWEATQALLVRQEAVNSANLPGKFADLYEMRTLQETILELAKSRQVVTESLAAVSGGASAARATEKDIEVFRRRLAMRPPNGAEFGKTEVFYVSVRDPDAQRAIALVTALCDQLEARLKKLRNQKADGLIAELEKQVELAAESHSEQTAALRKLETRLGPDLGELRLLNSASSGQSDLRQQLVAVGSEARVVTSEVEESRQLLRVLQAAQTEPERLTAMPNSLLSSQPALRRLKDGLVDAQLRTARLNGKRTENHPSVQAAIDSEARVRRDLFRELEVAVDGLQVQIGVGEARLAQLEARLSGYRERLGRLAADRAEYSNRLASVDNSRTVLDNARQKLSAAIAAKAAAQTASLVTRIDSPETGSNPIGIRRAAVVGVAVVGGALLGIGWIVLMAPAPARPKPGVHQGASASKHADDAEDWWKQRETEEPLRSTHLETVGARPQSVEEHASSTGAEAQPAGNGSESGLRPSVVFPGMTLRQAKAATADN
ncbi:MAG: Wzz/FepE/Etk N-terminal domain-containing protein [Planctomycetota bacterium]